MSEEEEIAVWKAGYIEKGLPEAILDEMIAEANLEWTSELQYSEYDRYALLNVKIEDNDPTEGGFYLITVQRADWVFQGKALLEKEWLFAAIPTVEVVIQVFKLKMNETLDILAWGYSIFKHTKDEDVTVIIGTVFSQKRKVVVSKGFELFVSAIVIKEVAISEPLEITLNITSEYEVTVD